MTAINDFIQTKKILNNLFLICGDQFLYLDINIRRVQGWSIYDDRVVNIFLNIEIALLYIPVSPCLKVSLGTQQASVFFQGSQAVVKVGRTCWRNIYFLKCWKLIRMTDQPVTNL